MKHTSTEDGYRLWLRYDRIEDDAIRTAYASAITEVVVENTSVVTHTAMNELTRALTGLLDKPVKCSNWVWVDGAILVRPYSTEACLHPDAFRIFHGESRGKRAIIIEGGSDTGALYGVFRFIRHIQLHLPLNALPIDDTPVEPLRMLNHWDNLFDEKNFGYVERGYAGGSIFDWEHLSRDHEHYHDYGRALASVGINAIALNNVNTQVWVLRDDVIDGIAHLANTFRKYGIRLFITIDFNAPERLDRLHTSDPFSMDVVAWWSWKAAYIYERIPDFGGFLVKANSEGMPGPLDYGRTHADGANMFADILAPYGGVIVWRTFVWGEGRDRALVQMNDFKHLDGAFKENVIVQVKNGPLDFQPNEPVSALFSHFHKTNLMLEFQITQEYTGQATHLYFLPVQWERYLATAIDGTEDAPFLLRDRFTSERDMRFFGFAGIANVGDARNWCGTHLAQGNLYGFGRLAWNPSLTADSIADEFVRMTFSHDETVVATLTEMLLSSESVYTKYTAPLGLSFLCESGAHFEPDPENAFSVAANDIRDDGVGFDRTTQGSGYTNEFPFFIAKRYEEAATCPQALLLQFHHLPWEWRMPSGDTLLDTLLRMFDEGVSAAEALRTRFATLQGRIDDARFTDIVETLSAQVAHAKVWRDTCVAFFSTFANID